MAISVQLVILLLLLIIINLYYMSKKKYDMVFFVFVILLTFISKEENGIISGVPYHTGGLINLSLVGYDVLIILLLSVLLKRCKIKSLGKFWIRAIACMVTVFVIRFVIDGINFFSNKIFDNYLLPMACAMMAIRYLDKEKAIKVVRLLYACILINAVVGSCEYFIGKSLLFHEYYMNSVGWYPSTYYAQQYGIPFRCTAFLGHPLTNGMYYLMGEVYLFNNNKKWSFFKLLEFIILGFAIFATNSRGALLILSIYILFYLVSNKKALKLCFLAGCGVAIATGLNFQSVYNDIFIRDATGSSIMVRVNVLLRFLNIPIHNIIMGMGYNHAGTIFSQYTGGANAEISYIILLMENGVVGFGLWLLALKSIYDRNMCRTFSGIKYSGLVHGMLICFLLYAATSNSFADPGTLTYLLCFILALSRIGKNNVLEENVTYEYAMENKEINSELSV